MSGGPVVLGIDQGFSGARAAVMRSDGRVVGSGRAVCSDVRAGAYGPEHLPLAWFDEVTAAVRQALDVAAIATVDAIGIGALGPAPVLLDADLRPLAPAPLLPPDPGVPFERWTGDDRLMERAEWLVDVCGFLVSSLVGRPVLDRITAAEQHFPEGWPNLRRPDVQEPFAVADGLTVEAAADLGLTAGTPVIVGTYDTFIDLAALGVRDPCDRGILLGSTLILGEVRERDRAPHGLRASLHAGAGWFVGGWTQAAGRSLSWARSAFGDQARASAAALSPGAGGLLALPYLDGERAPVWDPHARGAVVGLTTSTTPAQLYRAIVDAVALSAADLADRLGSPSDEERPWSVAGGGSRDDVWLRSTVDAIGEPMLVADLSDATAAARAAFGVLDLPPPHLPTRRVRPDGERHVQYAQMLAPYRELYRALAPTVASLREPATEGVP